jgi:hypothetical protein
MPPAARLTGVKLATGNRRIMASMAAVTHRTIPIRPVAAVGPAVVVPPELHGSAEKIHRLLDRLHPAIDAEFGRPVQDGEWLRSIDLHEGEAFVRLQSGLGCHAREVAELTFDALRRLLPDTDIYVGA